MRQLGIDIGMNRRASPFDENRDHVRCFQETRIIVLAVGSFRKQGLVGLRHIGAGHTRDRQNQQRCTNRNCFQQRPHRMTPWPQTFVAQPHQFGRDNG